MRDLILFTYSPDSLRDVDEHDEFRLMRWVLHVYLQRREYRRMKELEARFLNGTDANAPRGIMA